MRLLHAGDADDRARAPHRRAERGQGAHPRSAVGKALPLHRLHSDRRSGLRSAQGVPEMIGKPVERIEDLRLLRGRGSYVDDQHIDGMLHAAILRSSIAHGRIRRLAIDKARAMPGVQAVLAAADIAKGAPVPRIPLRLAPLPQLVPYEQPVIAQQEVNYVGEPIAVVIADTLARAEDALDAIELDIEALP